MSDETLFQQDNMGGAGEVMEVMMTGGDGTAMTEDTLTQVVQMLQVEGQLSAGGSHTIIIRQHNSDEIQMIQVSTQNGEVIVNKASAADIQTLQADAAMNTAANELISEQQGGQVMMVDETGNLVEGVVEMSPVEPTINSTDLSDGQEADLITTTTEKNVKDVDTAVDLLASMVRVNGNTNEYLVDSKSNSSAGSTISATGSIKHAVASKIHSSINETVVIKVDTRCTIKARLAPLNTITISTITGTQKYQAPKFHKCEACVINFVSKVAYMNHMESCTKQKKAITSENSQYSCVFCSSKFNTRVVLMQHVQTCQRAKESNVSLANSKVKINIDGKSKHGTVFKQHLSQEASKKTFNVRQGLGSKKPTMILDADEDVDNDLMENDFDSEDEEKHIVYDDDEDINDEDFDDEDDDIEDSIPNRKSQKHLGPIILNGLFKCRDCNRTFTKENQYNRHVRACTMAPLNSSRVDNDMEQLTTDGGQGETEDLPLPLGMNRKRRGAPLKSFLEERSPKRPSFAPKIVSVDPKKVVAASMQGKFLNSSDNEFVPQTSLKIAGLLDDGRKLPSKFNVKGKKLAGVGGSNISKIVKVSPADNIIKKSGKALLSKINQKKTMKALRDKPICGLCGDKFKSSQDLGLHIQANHSDDLLALRDLLDGKKILCSTKCPLCELYFNPNSLLFHMVTYHAGDLQLAQDELEGLNLNLLCPYCNTISVSQGLLKEHLARKHFHKIANRPAPFISPVAIDINKLLKERTNGTNMPVIKQDKVLCPECNLFISARYFSHHKCVSEVLPPTEKKFVCSEDCCKDITFYKVDHLLTHLIQSHNDLVPSVDKFFENLSQFMEWLKEEELSTKMKYTKNVQRLKQGKLCGVWICHQFHNSMTDSYLFNTSSHEKLNADNLCYSRIQVETSFNMSTSRYDGGTSIKYFPEHVHKSVKPVSEVTPPKIDSSPKKIPLIKDSDKVPFTNTDELKNLLEDSITTDDTPSKPEEPITAPSEEEPKTNQEVAADVHATDVEMVDESLLQAEINNHLNDEKVFEETSSSKDMKADSGLVSMADPDEFLLEKMLGEHHSTNPMATSFEEEESTKMDYDTSHLKSGLLAPPPTPFIESPASSLATPASSLATPTSSLATPASSQAASASLDRLLMSEDDDKVPVDVMQQQPIEKDETAVVNTSPPNDTEDATEEEEADADKDSDVEESTYVLPADLEEWRKLCQLVKNNLQVSKLPKEELDEATKFLALGTTIAQEPVEKQVEVFTKLCSLANVHL